MGNLALSRWFENAWRRRAIMAALGIIFALLSLFPKEYRAVVTLSPTDAASLGLGGALGQLGAFSSVFGNQAATEVSLKVARSMAVRRIVIEKLDLMRVKGFSNSIDADRWLTGAVSIRSLRGGILQFESKGRDPELRQAMVGAFAEATRLRMAEISRTQTAYKRKILTDLVDQSSERVNRAQAAYDAYRRDTRYLEPSGAIGGMGGRVASIEATLKQREIALEQARAFATDNNISVRQIIAEMDVLRRQLAEARSLNPSEPYSVNRAVIQLTRIQKLERELGMAKGLNDSYKRFLEGTAVEDLTASGNIRILEPPYIDSARQFRTIPAALLIFTMLVAIGMELYLLRPPVGVIRTEARRPS